MTATGGTTETKRPSRGRSSLPLQALVALLITGIFLYYLSFAQRYPHYFSWDMDQHTMLDCVLIQDGTLPDNAHHPGLGMYLILSSTHELAHDLGWVSVLTLGDLSGALNPIVGAAELLGFFRLHSPFVVVAIVLLLWCGLRVLFRPGPVLAILLLLVLATQRTLLYQAAVIRSELYSVFYWSLAFFLLALALRARGSRRACVFLLAAGTALGLSYLTKIQGIFLLPPFGLLLLFLVSSRGALPPAFQAFTSRRAAVLLHHVAILNLVVFLLLTALSYPTVPSELSRLWRAGFGLGTTWLLGAGSLGALAVLQTVSTSERFARWRPLSCLHLLASGFLGAFLLHFVLLGATGSGWAYLLADFKMVFLSDLRPSLRPDETWSIDRIVDTIRLNEWQLFLVGSGFVALLVFALRGRSRLEVRRSQVVLAWLLLFAWLGATVFGTRLTLRDLIWSETLGLVVVACLGGVLASLDTRWLRPVVGGAWSLLLLVQADYARAMPFRVDASRHLFGFSETRTFDAGWEEGGQGEFERILEEHYGAAVRAESWWPLFAQGAERSAREVGQRQARRHAELRRVVRFVFPNQRVSLRQVGVVWEGFPAWVSEPGFRITEYPAAFREALLIDNGDLPLLASVRFDPDIVNHKSPLGKLRADDLRTIVDRSADERLAILPRADLRTWLFVEEQDWETVAEHGRWSQAPRIVLIGEGEERALGGLPIERYEEIPLDLLKGRTITVIQ